VAFELPVQSSHESSKGHRTCGVQALPLAVLSLASAWLMISCISAWLSVDTGRPKG
jgi:hypothetical protein